MPSLDLSRIIHFGEKDEEKRKSRDVRTLPLAKGEFVARKVWDGEKSIGDYFSRGRGLTACSWMGFFFFLSLSLFVIISCSFQGGDIWK